MAEDAAATAVVAEADVVAGDAAAMAVVAAAATAAADATARFSSKIFPIKSAPRGAPSLWCVRALGWIFISGDRSAFSGWSGGRFPGFDAAARVPEFFDRHALNSLRDKLANV